MGGLAGQVPEGRGRPLSSAEIQKDRERERQSQAKREASGFAKLSTKGLPTKDRERVVPYALRKKKKSERERESPLAVKPLIQGALAHSYDCPSWLRGRREREEEAFRFTGAFAKRKRKYHVAGMYTQRTANNVDLPRQRADKAPRS